MEHDLEAICALVRECGRSIKDIDRSTLQIDSKAGHANFVTDIDGNALAYGHKSSVLARNKVAKPIE